MKQLIGLAFLLIAITMLIFYGIGNVTTLMEDANQSVASAEDASLTQSFNTAKNVTTGAFSVMANLPLLIVVIIVLIVLFMFVAITR